MRRIAFIRLCVVLLTMFTLGLADMLLPPAEAAPRPVTEAPMACDCGTHCTCTGDMSCCTDGNGTCGMSDRKPPADAPTSHVRPLPPLLLSMARPWWQGLTREMPPTRAVTYQSPLVSPPDPPPWHQD